MKRDEQTWVRKPGCDCPAPHKPGHVDMYYGEGLSKWCPGWEIKREIENTNPFNS